MSKIIYLLGAGASFGEREINNNQPVFGKIKRGLPIVNELEAAIGYYLEQYESRIRISGCAEPKKPFPKTYDELTWLRNKCKNYPTIDTYAKQLSVTHNPCDLSRLKRTLAAFFSLIQKPESRDMRYDGFIASLVDENGSLPDDVSILSWNYDCQLEYVLNDFSMAKSAVTRVWLDRNIGAKHYLTPKDLNKNVIYKINGTALFTSNYDNKCLLDTRGCTPEKIEEVLKDDNDHWTDNISFAWEKDENMENTLANIVKDAKVLVVIGYSFPYVNRSVDKIILNGMPNLQHVYIQDVHAEDVKQSLLSTLNENIRDKKDLLISCLTSVQQFYIPREL